VYGLYHLVGGVFLLLVAVYWLFWRKIVIQRMRRRFIGKVMGTESILYFRKGPRGVALSSFIDTGRGWPGKPYVNQQQLRQLAALILSRM